MASSSSSSTSSSWQYDVFLSFRGEDTRTNFTDHLYDALNRAGICTFRDDNELKRGEEIGLDLLKAIEKSRFSVVVFSENYASSRWCLDELAHIMSCRKTRGQTVLPVFYDVSPTDVRHQKRSYEKAFGRHEDRFKKQKDNQGQSWVSLLHKTWVSLLHKTWNRFVGPHALPHNDSCELEAKLQRWRAALKEAANLSGYHVGNRPQSAIINKIVEDISNELQPGKLKVAMVPVGLDSRSNAVKSKLVAVRIVGICGIGGIGKTTVAKEVYNSLISEFEGSSFLFNVREEFSLKCTTDLQRQLLFDILKRKDETIFSSDRGLKVIEERLRNKKILVVLDDVDDEKQIEKILGNLYDPYHWLSLESRIIITTRIKDLLPSKVYFQHELESLNQLESLWLFSINAFGKWLPQEKYLELSKSVADLLQQSKVHRKYHTDGLNTLDSLWLLIIKAFNGQGHPIKDYKEYSTCAVDYCRGIPLAIEVLGSYLSVEKGVLVWKSKLEKLEKHPHDSIQTILKTSYDSLDVTQKKIFLDIACFFIGKDEDYITCILDGCGFFAVDGINVLIKRRLLNIQFKKLEMHDLIRDMGRHIVVQESFECGERSRICNHEEAFALLQHKTGTKAVEGLILNLPQSSIKFSTEAFREMNRLRLLQLSSVNFTGSYEHISKRLRWLYWNNFPLESIPTNLHLGNVVTLDMPYSKLKQVWDEKKDLGQLKFLNLSHSHELRKISNFEGLSKLEILILTDCPILVEVHKSIKLLTKLITLNLEDCKNLENLPELGSLINLVNLNLSGCSKLGNAQKLPEELGKMKSLDVLAAYGTAIKGQNPSGLLPVFLTNLDLSYCNLSDNMIPNYLQNFPSLKRLNLEGNNFSSLPPTISLLTKLTFLRLTRCRRLYLVPKLPLSIIVLYINYCTKLKRLPKLQSVFEYYWNFDGCDNLVEIEGEFKMDPVGVEIIKKLVEPLGFSVEESIANLRMALMNFFSFSSRLCPPQGLSEKGIYSLFFPGSEIPSCWIHQSTGKSVSFNVPPLQGCTIQGFIICVVYASSKTYLESYWMVFRIRIRNKTKRIWSLDYVPSLFCVREKAGEDMTWLSYWSFEKAIFGGRPFYNAKASMFNNKMEEGDEVELEVEDKPWSPFKDILVKKCGVHILYQQNDQALENSSQEQQHFHLDHGPSGYEENVLDDLEDEAQENSLKEQQHADFDHDSSNCEEDFLDDLSDIGSCSALEDEEPGCPLHRPFPCECYD